MSIKIDGIPELVKSLPAFGNLPILKTPVLWLLSRTKISRGRNKERQTTLWIRQHAFLRSAQTLEVFFDRHLNSAIFVQRGDRRGKLTVLLFLG